MGSVASPSRNRLSSLYFPGVICSYFLKILMKELLLVNPVALPISPIAVSCGDSLRSFLAFSIRTILI